MNEVIEIFRNHGLDIEHGASRTEIASTLMQASEDELWPVFDDMTVSGQGVGFSAEGRIRKTTLVYALANACENGIKVIDQEMVNKALEKATNLCVGLFGKEFATREDDSSVLTEHQEDGPTVSSKRKRSPTLYPKMLQYVKDNPNATKEDAVAAFSDKFPDKAESTLGQYYHKARVEAGLKPNGKRGRQKSDTYPTIKAIVAQMMEADQSVTAKTIKEAVLKQYPDIKESSAQVYVYKARKELTE